MAQVSGPKIVTIGGGSGSSVVLEGLKPHTDSLTAIVTMFDSGGSSGALHDEFGYPPLGDLRRCLTALREENEVTDALRTLVEFRFDPESSLNGHSLGNLLMAALTSIRNDVEGAIEEMSRMLGLRGRVVPVSLEWANLCAELEDETVVRGESSIDLRAKRTPRICRVFLEPSVAANPRAVEAILDADAVVMGPGDLYTSIIPNLLVGGIAEAIRETKATRIYMCNLMTKLGETDDFKASVFVREIVRYLGTSAPDWVVVNNQAIPEEIQRAYAPEGARPVEVDMEELQRYVPFTYGRPLANNRQPLRHDPSSIARAILSVIGSGREAEGEVVDEGRLVTVTETAAHIADAHTG